MSKCMAFLSVALATAVPVLTGCGSDVEIELSYVRPAKVQIPERVKRVAVGQFSGISTEDHRWAEATAEKLWSELDQWNREFKRYQLVDRNNLAKILREQDIKIMNSDTAVQMGKLANVQAMIYGNVRVSARDDHGTKTYFDVFSQTMKTKPYTKRYCQVSVGMTMTDVDTATSFYSKEITRGFDSEKDGGSSGAGAFFGFSSDTPPPIDQTINQLVEQVVAEFCQQISPHREVVRVPLEKGKTKSVAMGNKLAKVKEYGEALEKYKAGMAEAPEDDGAVFNAGAMYEALLDFENAFQCYDKAFKMNPDKNEYVEARRRVRQESK